MADKRKREVRDIQRRTCWPYQFCLYLCRALGYEEVSRAIDAADDAADEPGQPEDPDHKQLGITLNRRAATATRVAAGGGK